LTSCKPVSFSRRTLHHAVSKLNTSGRPTLNLHTVADRLGLPKFLDNRPMRMVRLSALSPSPIYPPPPVNTTDIHFCYKLSQSQGHSAAGKITITKITITQSVIEPATFLRLSVPQTNAPLRNPKKTSAITKYGRGFEYNGNVYGYRAINRSVDTDKYIFCSNGIK